MSQELPDTMDRFALETPVLVLIAYRPDTGKVRGYIRRSRDGYGLVPSFGLASQFTADDVCQEIETIRDTDPGQFPRGDIAISIRRVNLVEELVQ